MYPTLKELKPNKRNRHAKEDSELIYICFMKQCPINLWSMLEVCWVPLHRPLIKNSAEKRMDIDIQRSNLVRLEF